mgnify:CR=1 FL=1
MVEVNQNNNARIIVVQKLYGYFLNKESKISFPKHRYKKFIKDVVNGTIERKELIQGIMDKELKEDINVNRTDLLIKLIIEAAIYEFMYMHKTPVKVVISEYLKTSDGMVSGGPILIDFDQFPSMLSHSMKFWKTSVHICAEKSGTERKNANFLEKKEY